MVSIFLHQMFFVYLFDSLLYKKSNKLTIRFLQINGLWSVLLLLVQFKWEWIESWLIDWFYNHPSHYLAPLNKQELSRIYSVKFQVQFQKGKARGLFLKRYKLGREWAQITRLSDKLGTNYPPAFRSQIQMGRTSMSLALPFVFCKKKEKK